MKLASSRSALSDAEAGRVAICVVPKSAIPPRCAVRLLWRDAAVFRDALRIAIAASRVAASERSALHHAA